MIIAHVAGLTQSQKETFKNELLLMRANYTIIDLDDYTDEIMNDPTMSELVQQHEYNINKSKELTVTKTESKNHLIKSKELNTRINDYWKSRMEFYLNELTNNCPMSTILIGYINFYKNIKIVVNLDVKIKVFININMECYSKETIARNLDLYKDEIINGQFNLEMVNHIFLIKRREMVMDIYDKKKYVLQELINCIGNFSNDIQEAEAPILYYASECKYIDNIPLKPITAYVDEWIAISSAIGGKDVTKGYIDNDYTKAFIQELKPEIIKKFYKKLYLYVITNTALFIPLYTKNYIYKYKINQNSQIFKTIEIDNAFYKLRELNISFYPFEEIKEN